MIKHARSSMIITKLKEIELMFRKLLIDSSLGSIQSVNDLYSSIDLPLTKITELRKRIIEKENETLEEIKAKLLINEILETTGSDPAPRKRELALKFHLKLAWKSHSNCT